MPLDENKRVLIDKINDLRDDFLRNIYNSIELKTKEKNEETLARLKDIKKKLNEIMRDNRINIDSEYADGQLDVLNHQLIKLSEEPNGELYNMISSTLNRYVEELSVEKEDDDNETKPKAQLQYWIEENKKDRQSKDSNISIPKINEYINDVITNALKRVGLEARIDLDELKRSISEFKNRNIFEMEEFFNGTNNNLTSIINEKVEEFFGQLKQITEKCKQNDGEKKDRPFGHYEIDHGLAIAKAEENAALKETQRGNFNELLGDVIK